MRESTRNRRAVQLLRPGGDRPPGVAQPSGSLLSTRRRRCPSLVGDAEVACGLGCDRSAHMPVPPPSPLCRQRLPFLQCPAVCLRGRSPRNAVTVRGVEAMVLGRSRGGAGREHPGSRETRVCAMRVEYRGAVESEYPDRLRCAPPSTRRSEPGVLRCPRSRCPSDRKTHVAVTPIHVKHRRSVPRTPSSLTELRHDTRRRHRRVCRGH